MRKKGRLGAALLYTACARSNTDVVPGAAVRDSLDKETGVFPKTPVSFAPLGVEI
jgi:hypothetical protein